MTGNIETRCYYLGITVAAKMDGLVHGIASMSNMPIFLQVIWGTATAVVGIALAVAPIMWISRQILAPIDRAAKFRKAPVRFSIGDFLCLFLAIQIPLAAVHRFMGEDYWTFTIITWLVAPVIWYAGARTLSKARVTTNSHRFVFLGLIMPLVYYGLVPFTVLGISFLAVPLGHTPPQFRWMLLAWFVLSGLFFVSGRFVRWMVRQVQSEEPPISDRQHENELFRAVMLDTSSAASADVTTSNG
jgi:hypothetical protein